MAAAPTLSQTAHAVSSGQLSAAEALSACIARIEATEERVNAFTGTRFEAARAQAARVDAMRARGEPLGPLAGVPFAVKNLFDIEGEVTLESDDFTETYCKGDAFMLPKGFRGYWRQPEAVLKYYVLIG